MRGPALLLALLPAPALAEAVIVTHLLEPGVTIAEGDVTLVDADIPGAVTSLEAALGQAVTEVVYPGRPVLLAALGRPKIITRNQRVSLVYQVGGLQILAQGRALSDGAVGEEIRIMNSSSHATVTGTIAADGTVHVSPKKE